MYIKIVVLRVSLYRGLMIHQSTDVYIVQLQSYIIVQQLSFGKLFACRVGFYFALAFLRTYDTYACDTQVPFCVHIAHSLYISATRSARGRKRPFGRHTRGKRTTALVYTTFQLLRNILCTCRYTHCIIYMYVAYNTHVVIHRATANRRTRSVVRRNANKLNATAGVLYHAIYMGHCLVLSVGPYFIVGTS